MKIRWLSLIACLALAALAPGTAGRAAAADEFHAALGRAWAAHSFRLAVAHVDNVQGDSGILRDGTWVRRAEVVAAPNGEYSVNMVQTEAGQALTQTLYLPQRSCLRPRAWLAWGCADRSVDSQISDEQAGWLRQAPLLLTPGLPFRLTDEVTQRIGSRLVDVYTVDPGAGSALLHIAIDRATDTIIAMGAIAVSASYHDIWVLRYSDWNDPSIVMPAGTQGAVPLPRPARHALVATPAAGGPFALLWPLYLSPRANQANAFKLALRRAFSATSANLAVQYVDENDAHGRFSGQIMLQHGSGDVDFTGSEDGLPPVEVAVTAKQECARHPGRHWSCLDLQKDTRYPILDVLSVVPFLTADQKGTVLFAGSAVVHGRVLDKYLVLSNVNRLVTVSIDRQSGMLASVELHQNVLGILNVRVAYSNWNAQDVTSPLLPPSSMAQRT